MEESVDITERSRMVVCWCNAIVRTSLFRSNIADADRPRKSSQGRDLTIPAYAGWTRSSQGNYHVSRGPQGSPEEPFKERG